MTPTAYLNAVGTAVPPRDVHAEYLDFAHTALGDTREHQTFERLVSRSRIDHRYAVIPMEFYANGIPDTAARMIEYEKSALALTERAIAALGTTRIRETTHLIVTSCTGFYAPGIDIQLIDRLGLDPAIERTIVGFMGCYAAVTALKLARHIVRSEPAARVLLVNVELCSLHLQPPVHIEAAMGFSIFADGCAASIVSADPTGISLDAFSSVLIPDSEDEITWRIGALGFDMRLALDVPRQIAGALTTDPRRVLGGTSAADVDIWAIHPGGRAVLDAVETALGLAGNALDHSRDVLRSFGNMSSATISFVLERVLRDASKTGAGSGCALAFGPGMMCEAMRFSVLT